MGLVYAELKLSNPVDSELVPFDVQSLVDSGALHLCIPEHFAFQLKLNEIEKREVTLDDGCKKLIPYAGPIKVSFSNRNAIVGTMIMEDEVLLGAIPMEDLDVVTHPAKRTLRVNPESPNIAMSKAK